MLLFSHVGFHTWAPRLAQAGSSNSYLGQDRALLMLSGLIVAVRASSQPRNTGRSHRIRAARTPSIISHTVVFDTYL